MGLLGVGVADTDHYLRLIGSLRREKLTQISKRKATFNAIIGGVILGFLLIEAG